MGDSFYFAVYVHHGGRFVNLEGSDVYVEGECEGNYELDSDRFGFFDAEELVEKLGYTSWGKIWFKIPHSIMSYRLLTCDDDVMKMLSLLTPQQRVLHFYIEGCKVDENGKKSENENMSNVESGSGLKTDKVGVTNEHGSSALNGDKAVAKNQNVGVENQRVRSEKNCDNVGVKHQQSRSGKVVSSEGEKKYGLDGYDSEYGGDEFDDDNREDDDNSEDEDFNPGHGEESADDLDDDELASDDEEYVNARKKVRAKHDIFDLVGQNPKIGLGFNQVVEHGESDYADSDGDVCSDSTDEEGEAVRNNKFKSSYDPRTKPKKLEIKLGMRFEDGFQNKKALRDNAIALGHHLKFDKVGKIVCQAKCRGNCEWRLYASRVQADDYFCVKTYYPKHKCRRKTNNKLMSSAWVSEYFMNVFRVHPNLPIKILAEYIRKKFVTIPGKDRLYRARAIAQEQIRGSVEQHYALLRRYVAELIRLDPDGKYLLQLGEEQVFKGLYIGHSSLRDGFKQSCRPVIGLDGYFLKTYLRGILLAAVGKDGNNQMFPIAWAIVEVENEACWKWFLQHLLEDLAISDGNGWTFISDQQKGLMNAVSELAPHAEHRNCARHVYMNWKKQHKGTALKNLFWRVARSTYIQEYKKNLEVLKAENEKAHDDFVARDVKRFCKCFLSLGTCSDIIDNNIAETFNGYILAARGMHIIHMCEQIRRDLMVRQVDNLKMISHVEEGVCPVIVKKIDEYIKEGVRAYVFPNFEEKYEVCLSGITFVVSLKERICSCRRWDLTGIPCVHACAAIGLKNEDPISYVHPYYSVERYLKAYKVAIQPVVSEEMWPEVEGYVVKPPLIRKLPGRPKKKRRRAPEEDPKNPHKLRRFGLVMTCKNCKQKGDNILTCSNPKAPEIPKGARGRPRIHPPQPPKENGQSSKRGRPKKQASMPSSQSNLTRNEGPSTQESRAPSGGI